jgi:hypothetical protein
VCDGTADQVEINAALALAAPLQSRNASAPTGAQQRGRVLLTGGRFNISAPILIHTATSLWGCGFGTELRSISNNGTGMINLATPGAHLTEVAHLYMYGNYSAGGTCRGINFDMSAATNPLVGEYPSSSPDAYHFIHDLFIDGFSSGSRTSVYVWSAATTNNRGNIIRDLQIRNGSDAGIHLSAASDSFISGCHIGTIGTAYRIASGNTKISNCKSFYSNTYGLHITSGRGLVSGFESQDDASGVYVAGGPVSMSSIVIDTCSGFGMRIGASGTKVGELGIFLRGSARYTTQSIGLQIDAGVRCNVTGDIDPSNITTPYTGTAASGSFVRVYDGTSLRTVG